MRKPILRVIDGGQKPKRHRRRSGISQQWVCARCDHDIGVATSVAVQVLMCPETDGRRLSGGLRAWVCAACLVRGVTTRIT